MHSGDAKCISDDVLFLTCGEGSSFNRNLLLLVKQWDKKGRFQIVPGPEEDLSLLDEDGVCWNGAEAVPIIFKNLPFGKLAAAMYILPGTMWFTKQLYAMQTPHKPQKRAS
jgi:hypothetical protein